MQRREWTQEDLAELTQAVATLERLGVRNVTVAMTINHKTEAYVRHSDLAQIAALAGVRPGGLKPSGQYWSATVELPTFTVDSLFTPDQLPQIGYRITEVPRPVPMAEPIEEMTADG